MYAYAYIFTYIDIDLAIELYRYIDIYSISLCMFVYDWVAYLPLISTYATAVLVHALELTFLPHFRTKQAMDTSFQEALE